MFRIGIPLRLQVVQGLNAITDPRVHQREGARGIFVGGAEDLLRLIGWHDELRLQKRERGVDGRVLALPRLLAFGDQIKVSPTATRKRR